MPYLAMLPGLRNVLSSAIHSQNTSHMKATRIIEYVVGVGTAVLTCGVAVAQGTFQNLDFEQANPVVVQGSPYYPYEVTAASALPYWTVTIGGVQQTQVLFDTISTGSPDVDLIGPGTHFGYSPIDGDYSVVLQGTFSAAAISQTGLIPSGTQSLLFDAQPPFPPLIMSIRIAKPI
jgi:hypothetical protein